MTGQIQDQKEIRYFGQFAETLLDNGYDVIPLETWTKETWWERWNRFCFKSVPVKYVEKAARSYPTAGIGFVCGSKLVVIDIDEDDGAKAYSLQRIAEECLGSATELIRFGQKGRRSLLYRVEGPPIDSWDCGRVQLLGKNRYTVALGIHPETRRPYTWPYGRPELTPLESLPVASQAGIDELQRRLTDHYGPGSGLSQQQATGRADRRGLYKKRVRAQSSLLSGVVYDEAGRVIDGRYSYLRYCVMRAFQSGGGRAESIADIAWDQFREEADLTRPKKSGRTRWSKADVLLEARVLVRRNDRGRVVALARHRTPKLHAVARPITERERVALEKAVLFAMEDGRLSRSAVQVHREMMSFAAKSGECFVAVDKLAERLEVSVRTVTAARERLRKTGFWHVLDATGGRGRLTKYVPNPVMAGLRNQSVDSKQENRQTVQESCHIVYCLGEGPGSLIPPAANDRRTTSSSPGRRKLGA